MARHRGRPKKYTKDHADIAYKLSAAGLTDKQMALALGVSKSTINRWKHDHPYFWDSLKRGKMLACCEVAKALYKRAIGYETIETKTFFNRHGKIYKTITTTKWIHADVRAARLLLSIKYPEIWKK